MLLSGLMVDLRHIDNTHTRQHSTLSLVPLTGDEIDSVPGPVGGGRGGGGGGLGQLLPTRTTGRRLDVKHRPLMSQSFPGFFPDEPALQRGAVASTVR